MVGKKNLITIALFPLILSIGLAPAIPFASGQLYMDRIYAEEYEMECREGLYLVYRIPNADYICTDDATAIRWVQLGIAEIVTKGAVDEEVELIEEQILAVCTLDYTPVCGVDGQTYSNMCMLEVAEIELASTGECQAQEIAEAETPDVTTRPQTFETIVGTIKLDHDYLTPESAELLSDELFFQRAILVYHLALPAVGGAGIFYEQDKVGATTGDVIYWSDFMNSDIELLTGNTSVLYFMTLQDLSNGPIVVSNVCGLVVTSGVSASVISWA